jgi:hypothetical protein
VLHHLEVDQRVGGEMERAQPTTLRYILQRSKPVSFKAQFGQSRAG